MKNIKDKNNSQIQEIDSNKENPKLSLSGRLFRFLVSWLGFTGFYAMFSVCPSCRQQGCPVGLASASTVGAFLALCIQDWKRFVAYIKQKLRKKSYK